jgi:putative endonuclease
MASPRQSLGRWGENLAAEYLANQGYTIIERNFRTPYGELDLVARQIIADQSIDIASGFAVVTVFVEVKTRSSLTYGLPEESVTPRKQAHLLNAANSYIQAHPELGGDWRIDVIAIQRYPDKQPEITHFENVLH